MTTVTDKYSETLPLLTGEPSDSDPVTEKTDEAAKGFFSWISSGVKKAASVIVNHVIPWIRDNKVLIAKIAAIALFIICGLTMLITFPLFPFFPIAMFFPAVLATALIFPLGYAIKLLFDKNDISN